MLRLLFNPPPPPDLHLPPALKLVPHFRDALIQGCERIYFTGVTEGFLVGVLVALVLPGIFRLIRDGGRRAADRP